MTTFTNQQALQHLLWRATFSPTIQDLQTYQNKSVEQVVDALFQKAQHNQPLSVLSENFIQSLQQLKSLAKPERKALLKTARQKIQQLNLQWLAKMAASPTQLREKMTFFWHNHFACEDKNAFFVQQQNNTLRKHALGNFGDLVLAIAKDPAMLKYLNNRQNRKAKPNENFARELLELFTLGSGNYTEQDIKEAARAFTGWNFDAEGNFVLRQRQHDFGSKTFLGQTGNWNGDDIIRIVLEQRQTAKFITTKIYRHFVNDEASTPKAKNRINQLATQFYNSNYDISQLLKRIFTANWFYQQENMATHIKSPVELLVGLVRTFQLKFDQPKAPLFIQRVLGQTLFNPPNVAGWPLGKAWIDSSSLTFRMSLAKAIFRNAALDIAPKSSLSMEAGDRKGLGKLKLTSSTVSLQPLHNHLKGLPRTEILKELTTFLWQVPYAKANKELLKTYAKGNTPKEQLLNAIVFLLTLPEYQLS